MRTFYMAIASACLVLSTSGCDDPQKPKPNPDSGQGASLPKGALLLMEASCPSGFADATGKYNGRVVMADNNAVDAPVLTDGDGMHNHGGGGHEHDVSGTVVEPGEGYREGGGGRRSAGIRSPIQGKAAIAEHDHEGGMHKHASVGLRLCQVQ